MNECEIDKDQKSLRMLACPHRLCGIRTTLEAAPAASP